MRSWRLIASLLLTAVAVVAAVFWVRTLWPRSETTEATVVQTPAVATPTPSAGVRLVIPSIGVDAPVVPAGWDEDGNMASPEAPEEVAWYEFTPRPGTPGNAVMAAHLNWRGGGKAAFAELANLAPGDAIEFFD